MFEDINSQLDMELYMSTKLVRTCMVVCVCLCVYVSTCVSVCMYEFVFVC